MNKASTKNPPLKGTQPDGSQKRFLLKWTANYKGRSVAGSMTVEGDSEEQVKAEFQDEFPKANIYKVEKMEDLL